MGEADEHVAPDEPTARAAARPPSTPSPPSPPSPSGGGTLPDEAVIAVLDQWPVGVIVTSATGQVAYANAEVARIWDQGSGLDAPNVDEFRHFRGLRPDGTPLELREWPLSRSLAHGEVVRAEEIHFERPDATRGVMEVSSAPIRIGDTIVAGVVLFVDVTERHDGEARAALLQRWTGDVGTTDAREVVTTLARELASVLGVGVAGYVVDHGAVAPVAGAPPATDVVCDAVASRSVIERSIGDGHRLAVPMVVRLTPVGAVEITRTAAPLDDATREVVVAVVRQGAHALERALVVDEERAARSAEELARRRAELTATIVNSLESVRGFQPRLQALARHVAAFGDWCLIELHSGDEVVRVADSRAASGQIDAEIVASYPSRARDPASASAEAGVATHLEVVPAALVDEVAHDARHRDALVRLGMGSLATVPFRLNAEATHGTITLAARSPGAIVSSDVELLVAIAAAVVPVLERERARDRERRIAATLQERLLPKVLTSAAGMLVAHRYQAGVDDLLVGGDWIDTIPLRDGRLGLVVGDVVGRGVEAAATMGQLRAALVALALDGSSPAAVLTKLDQYVTVNPSGRSTAVVYAIADAARGELRYSCAGHLPPLVLGGGQVSFATGGQGGPLGVWRGERDESMVPVDVGTTVVMFTDGLVERRGEPLDAGLARVEAVASKLADGSPEELCAGLLEGVFRGETPHDDVAVLAAAFCDPATTFLHRVPAYPRMLRDVRHALRDWLVALDIDAVMIDDMVLACGEACANVVEHAYRDVPTGELVVEAHVGARAVVCTVRDFGRWRAPGAIRPGGRGFGLVGELVDELAVERTPWGTTVRLRRDR